MATLHEVTDLFSKLALHLQTLNHASLIDEQRQDDDSLDYAISKLNQSLNIDEDSRVTVLDTALSLMCFKAPEVFDSTIEYLVKTIASVLSSSVSCKVLLFKKEEALLIGCSISSGDCVELVEVFSDVIRKLDGHGMLSSLLLHGIVRVAVHASCYRFLFPSRLVLDTRSIDGRSIIVSKLLCHLPCEFLLDNHRIPLRLLFWYLDPLTLKHDIENILQEAMGRPFLCLNKEFHERMNWRSIIISLVLSPVMFIEARVLLHEWLLLTGLGSILELLVELMSVILDVISRPTWWDISVELGSKLLHSNAYFPNQNHLLRTLAGPLSAESFLQLVHATSEPTFCARKQSDPNSKPDAMKAVMIDHKSHWALAVCFPDWFNFASVLLFSGTNFQEKFLLKSSEGTPKVGNTSEKEMPTLFATAAARYIAWILNPFGKSHQVLLADGLNKISVSWSLKQIGVGVSDEEKASSRKKLKKPKLYIKEDSTCGKYRDYQMIGIWLEDFHDFFLRYCNKYINNYVFCEAKLRCGLYLQHKMLRQIPLGILIGYPNYINEDGCGLLLHYAATGRMLQSVTVDATTKHVKLNTEGQKHVDVWGGNQFDKKEAITGACLVFSLTDAVERMAASLFETEESEADIVCRVKLRTGKYLVKCIKRLIQLSIDKEEALMLVDLHGRLMRWRNQGKEALELHEDLDDAFACLTNKLSVLS
ncbi:uncharacterized protein LOC119996719 [Tripterygium wilfordii]|uniref:uncharacterized protein LOC119996719 n=1 Tax=Tripterygium wilfordii TaxID=458696 RepID=UPI0018F803E1|nr:uncharacterized protein LOC119996719 [Tripterygium wilfordii]